MKTNIAEIKPAKFGETLASNVEGNPEPSLKVKEGVETRRRVCIKCGGEIPKTKYKNAKYCSDQCRSAYITQQYKIRHNLIECPGVGSGNNQSGSKNHQWKNGLWNFRKKAFSNFPNKCNRCGSKKLLLVHHKDEDRTNNNLSNLEILCKKCHQNHHCKRDPETGRYIKG